MEGEISYPMDSSRATHATIPSRQQVVKRDLVQQRLRGEVVEDARGREEALVLRLVLQEERTVVPHSWQHAMDAHGRVSAGVNDVAHKSTRLRDGLATKYAYCEWFVGISSKKVILCERLPDQNCHADAKVDQRGVEDVQLALRDVVKHSTSHYDNQFVRTAISSRGFNQEKLLTVKNHP